MLKLILDTLDGLSDAHKALYAEKDGKFHLQVDGIEDTSALKAALASEREANKVLKPIIAEWKRLGKSPTEIEELIAAEQKKAEDALKKAGKFDEVLQTHLGKAKQERDAAVSAAEKKAERALTIAKRAVVDSTLGAALAKGKATAEGLDLLKDRLGARVQIEFGDDGNESISILDADGKTPLVGSGKNGMGTFDDLVKEATKSYPSLFEGSGAGGSGADPKGQRQAGGKVVTRADFDKLGPIEKAGKMKEGFKLVD